MGGYVPADALKALFSHPDLSGEAEALWAAESAPSASPGDLAQANEAAFEQVVALEARADD